MALKIADAVKSQSKLRAAFVGGPGTGKTYSSLLLARYLKEIMKLDGPIVVIDSEEHSSSKYANVVPFKVIDLSAGGNYSPDVYCEAIDLAEDQNPCVIIADSLSHSYAGEGGLLAMADAAQKKGGNSFTSWRGVSSRHTKMIDRILHSKAHFISTMRAKVEYSVEKDEKGKTSVKKIGFGPIIKDGESSAYEQDIVFSLAQDNSVTVDKTRCSDLNGKSFDRIDRKVAEVIARWLSDGEPEPERATVPERGQTEQTEENRRSTVAPASADDQLSGWKQKISEASSIADLDSLLPILRTLKPEGQAALVPLYRERKSALERA